jgi:hypothetical protein
MHNKKGQEGLNPTLRTIVVVILVLILMGAISYIIMAYVRGLFGGVQ